MFNAVPIVARNTIAPAAFSGEPGMCPAWRSRWASLFAIGQNRLNDLVRIDRRVTASRNDAKRVPINGNRRVLRLADHPTE